MQANLENTLPSYTKPSTVRACVVVFTAALFFFYEFIQLNMFNAIDPYLLRDFKITAAELGHLSAYYFYGDVLFLFMAGTILDRVSTRKAILTAMFFSVSCTFVFAFAHQIWIAEIGRFVTGAAAAFCLLSCLRLATRWFSPRHMALVVGIIVTIAMLGGMVAQTPLTLLTDHFGWRIALMIDGSAGILMLAAIFFIVQDYPEGAGPWFARQRQALTELGFWKSLGRALSNLQNWLAGFYTSVLNLPIFLLGAIWGSLYLVQIHHLSRPEASYITSMIFVGTIIGSTVIGWISDRVGQRKLPMLICALCSLLVMLLIIYLPQLSLAMGMVLFFSLGFFTSGQIISYPLIAESNPPTLTATASGLASTLIMAGGISQPFFGWLMGIHWDQQTVNGIPLYSLHDYRLALWIMPIGFILGILATIPLKETYCQSHSQ